MAMTIVEELWTRIRAAIDDKIIAATTAAESAEADRVVVEQAAMSASWSGDRLTVLGAMSPPLTGPQGPEGPKGDSGDGTGDVLWSELNPILDGKANVGDVPVTDGGYGTRHASDPAADYPKGVSYGLFHAGDGWDAAIQSDTGHAGSNTFVMVQTLRQGGYSLSTTQMVFTYSNVHKPVFMRKWHGQAWGPFRSLTDDGHTHSQYATTAEVAARTPEIRVVSTIPASPTPGVVYLRFG